MLWSIFALDAADAEQRRQELREQHSAWLRSGSVRPVLYGPLLGPDRITPTGSLMVVEAPDRDTVLRHVDGDPFRTGGVWQQVHVHFFAQSARSPVQLPTA